MTNTTQVPSLDPYSNVSSLSTESIFLEERMYFEMSFHVIMLSCTPGIVSHQTMFLQTVLCLNGFTINQLETDFLEFEPATTKLAEWSFPSCFLYFVPVSTMMSAGIPTFNLWCVSPEPRQFLIHSSWQSMIAMTILSSFHLWLLPISSVENNFIVSSELGL